MSTHVYLTPDDLWGMQQRSKRAVSDARAGIAPTVDDVAALDGMVAALIDEVNALHWRITAATMTLDGRITHQQIDLTRGAQA